MTTRRLAKSGFLLAAAAALGVSGCMQTGGMAAGDMGEAESLTARLSGKTLTNETGGTIVLGADGSLSGVVEDAWTERDGQFCRTLTSPARLAGTLCQNVCFDDEGTVTFLTGAGGDTPWTIS